MREKGVGVCVIGDGRLFIRTESIYIKLWKSRMRLRFDLSATRSQWRILNPALKTLKKLLKKTSILLIDFNLIFML